MNYLHEADGSYTKASKLRQKLGLLLQKKAMSNNNSVSSIIETDYLKGISEEETENLRQRGIYTRQDDIVLHQTDVLSYGTFEDAIEDEKWQEVAAGLCNHLRARTQQLHLDVFLPTNLMERIAKDIVRMSCCEPCGLRGCTVHFSLERKNGTCHRLGKLQQDLTTVPTFELHLTLVQDKKRWYSLRDLLLPVVSGCLNETLSEEVYISPGYTLVKNKLYRQN